MTGPHAAQPPELITLPIILIALLKFSHFGVQLNRARDGLSAWCIRFSPSTILQVSDAGQWAWLGPAAWPLPCSASTTPGARPAMRR